MKQFIVFLALLLVFSLLMVYETDSNNYVHLQNSIKALADNCASGAILMQDVKESSKEGRYVINMTAAGLYIDEIISKEAVLSPFYNLCITYAAVTVPASTFPESNGAIEVCVTFSGIEIFRFKGMFPKEIGKSTKYETKIKRSY